MHLILSDELELSLFSAFDASGTVHLPSSFFSPSLCKRERERNGPSLLWEHNPPSNNVASVVLQSEKEVGLEAGGGEGGLVLHGF